MAAFSTIALIGISAVRTVGQMRAERRRQAAEKEARSIANANESSRARMARVRAAQEERLRRSRVYNVAAQTGTMGSSGLIGATSAIGANFQSAVARQTENTQAAMGISAANQRSSDAASAYRRWDTISTVATKAVGIGVQQNWFS